MIRKKARLRPQDNPFKKYHRKRTQKEIRAAAEQYRQNHLTSPTDGEMAFSSILEEMGIPSEPEHIIWYADGWKFIIIDFFLPKHGIAIEIDGQSHALKKPYDRERDNWLATQGIYCVRFMNNEVIRKKEKIVKKLLAVLKLTNAEKKT